MADFTVRPERSSSRMRSKMSTLASTAIPTVRMMPAMPGSVRVASKRGQGAEDQDDVERQRDDGVDAGELVDHEHGEDHQARPRGRPAALVDGVAAEGRADGALFEVGHAAPAGRRT